jgi:hypothetical protein
VQSPVGLSPQVGKEDFVVSPPQQVFHARWTDENIERALRGLCAGRDRFPSKQDFIDAGLSGLYFTLHSKGKIDLWTEKLGLERLRRGKAVVWNEERVEETLRGFCVGRESFPSAKEFRAAGLGGLYQTLANDDVLNSWAKELGLERGVRVQGVNVWTEENIDETLRGFCVGRERFPTCGEFRAAGLGGLYQTLNKNDALNLWADKLGLERARRSGSPWRGFSQKSVDELLGSYGRGL